MARLPFVDRAALPSGFAELPLHQNFQRVYANSPSGTRAFMGTTGEIRKRSALSPRLRELAVLEVGFIAKSPYVFTHHVKAGLEAGVTSDDVRALATQGPGALDRFNALERDVIEVAGAMTAGVQCAAETFERLRAQLGSTIVMDLLFVVGHYIGMAVLLRTLDVELEDDYKKYLKEYPLPF
jgi:alkylhydroperoxidase family enzyme